MTALRALLGALAVGVVALGGGCRGEARSGTAAGSGSAGSRAAGTDDKLAWPAIDDAALAALQTTERFELGAPVPLAITPDGAVLFRRSKPRSRVADLYQLDA